MALKDVSTAHIPPVPGAAPTPFGDDFPETARRYALRQPSNRPYLAAAVISAFWLGAAIAFIAGYLGFDGLLNLAWPWMAGLFFAVAFPISFVWFAAHMSRRSRGLQLASEDLLQIAARLIEPDASAGREITRLGRAVRREIDALNAGLEGALARVRTLDSAVSERLRAVEMAGVSLEERGNAIRAALREERESLGSFATALAGESERIGELVRSRGVTLKDLAKQASADLLAAQDTLDARAAQLKATLDQSTIAAQANAQAFDRGAQALVEAGEALDGRLDGFLQRGERQRSALNEAVNALKGETQALEQAIGRNLDSLGGLGHALAEQTRKTDAIASDITRRGEAAAGGLGARTDAIAAAFAAQVETIGASAAAAEEKLKATTDAAAEAAEKVRTTFEMAARSADTVSERTGELTSSAINAMTTAVAALTAKAEEARQAATAAIADLKTEADALPAMIAERLKEMRAAELIALPAPQPAAETPGSAAVDASSRPLGGVPPSDGTSGKPEWFGFARKLAGLIKRDPEQPPASRDWRLSTALANVDDRSSAAGRSMPAATTKLSVDLHREALHVVEKLQALAIDLDRALGDDPAPDLWRRYISGERSVFTRRLIGSIGRDGADKIAQRYAADTDFRLHADRYMTEFEGLLDDAASRDRDQILVETFLTSQTGRLYLLLAAATARL